MQKSIPITKNVFARGYSRKMCRNLLEEFGHSNDEPISRNELLDTYKIDDGKLQNVLGRGEDRCCAKSFEQFFEAVITVAKKEGYQNTGDKFLRLEKKIEKIKEIIEYEYNYKHLHLMSDESFYTHIKYELDKKHRIMLYHFFDMYIQIGMGAGSSFYDLNIKNPLTNLQGAIDKAYEIYNDTENVSTSDMHRVISVTKLVFTSKTELDEIHKKYKKYKADDLCKMIKGKILEFEEAHPNMRFYSLYSKHIFEANREQLQLLILWLGLSRKGKDLLLDYIFDEYLQ